MMLQGQVSENHEAPPRADALPGPYQTKLEPQHEAKFQSWVKDNKIPWKDEPKADYDMRGYYKDNIAKGDDVRKMSQFDNKPHFPDTYKTPYHESFSNESQYADKAKAPHWEGDKLINNDGSLRKDETPKQSSAPASQAMFRQRNKWAIPTHDDVEGEVK